MCAHMCVQVCVQSECVCILVFVLVDSMGRGKRAYGDGGEKGEGAKGRINFHI